MSSPSVERWTVLVPPAEGPGSPSSPLGLSAPGAGGREARPSSPPTSLAPRGSPAGTCGGPVVSPHPREGSRVARPEPTGPEMLRHGGGSPFPSHLASRPPARTTQRAVLPGSLNLQGFEGSAPAFPQGAPSTCPETRAVDASGLALPRPGPGRQKSLELARARSAACVSFLHPGPWDPSLPPPHPPLPAHLLPGPEVCLSFHDQNASHRPDNPSGHQLAGWPPRNVSEPVSAHSCVRLQGLSPCGPASPRLGRGGGLLGCAQGGFPSSSSSFWPSAWM